MARCATIAPAQSKANVLALDGSACEGRLYPTSDTDEMYIGLSDGTLLGPIPASTAESATVPGPYYDDTAAAAGGVDVDKVYRLAAVNGYDMPSPGGRTVVTRLAAILILAFMLPALSWSQTTGSNAILEQDSLEVASPGSSRTPWRWSNDSLCLYRYIADSTSSVTGSSWFPVWCQDGSVGGGGAADGNGIYDGPTGLVVPYGTRAISEDSSGIVWTDELHLVSDVGIFLDDYTVMGAVLDMFAHRIQNVANPAVSGDAVNLQTLSDSTAAVRADFPSGGSAVVYDSIAIDTISYTYDGLTLYAVAAYDSTTYNLPVVVVMHGFSQEVGDFSAATINRYAEYGVFALFVEMRGRGSSGGSPDAGGEEIRDIWAAVEYIKSTYRERVDPQRVSIVGYSGGGGNVYSSVTKFPYYYNAGVSFFGIADYGSDGSNGWYQNGASAAQQDSLEAWVGGTPAAVPNNYEARNSLRAIGNYPGRLFVYHDTADASVPIIQTTRLRDTATFFSVIDPYFNVSATTDATRWQHGLPAAVSDLITAENYFIPALKTATPLHQPLEGTLKVKGYVYTPEFRLMLGDGQNAYGEVRYNAQDEIYTISTTPSGITSTLSLPRQGRSTITAVVNGDTSAVATTGAWTSILIGGPDTLPVTSNLLAWYRADSLVYSDAGTTPVTGGGSVQQWNDLSGNGHHLTQTTTASKPTYTASAINGEPGITLDGTNDYMVFPGTNSASNYTFFYVVDATNTTGDPVGAEYFFDTQTGRLVLYHLGTSGGAGTDSDSIGYFDGAFQIVEDAVSGSQIVCFDLDSTSGVGIYRNGSTLSTGTSYTQKAIGGSSAMFSRYDGTVGWLQGDVCEVIVYNTSLSDSDRNSVLAYLRGRYATY